ncbi:DUF5134 domain-containing protein [Amycolatopsis sp. NPDC059027]|uniref:DUF5134 domain-containing protein n=1 Tax=unclassified Amycolatopsis TaxID=2618356 RepID=UPI00366D7BA3
MHGLVAVDWILTGIFVVLVLPCVLRLTRLDYVRLGRTVRNGDLAELLFIVAMIAMFSPVGGPIPAAGWQAVLVLVTGWFGLAWWRDRREHAGGGHEHPACGHHALSAVVMLYLVTAMPHGSGTHGPWLNMSTMDLSVGGAWPVLAAAAAYFVVDAVLTAIRALRPGDVEGRTSRAVCRGVMGLGMGYMLIAAL